MTKTIRVCKGVRFRKGPYEAQRQSEYLGRFKSKKHALAAFTKAKQNHMKRKHRGVYNSGKNRHKVWEASKVRGFGIKWLLLLGRVGCSTFCFFPFPNFTHTHPSNAKLFKGNISFKIHCSNEYVL